MKKLTRRLTRVALQKEKRQEWEFDWFSLVREGNYWGIVYPENQTRVDTPNDFLEKIRGEIEFLEAVKEDFAELLTQIEDLETLED